MITLHAIESCKASSVNSSEKYHDMPSHYILSYHIQTRQSLRIINLLQMPLLLRGPVGRKPVSHTNPNSSPNLPLGHEDEVFKEPIHLRGRLEQARHNSAAESVNVPLQVVDHAVQSGAVKTCTDLIQEESVAAAMDTDRMIVKELSQILAYHINTNVHTCRGTSQQSLHVCAPHH